MTLLLFPTLLLAGCNAPGNNGEDEEDDDDDVSEHSGIDSDMRSFQFFLAGPSSGPVPPAFDMGDMDVDANASGILIEARWTCESPTCSLDVILLDPDGEELVRAPGSGEVSFFVENLTEGTHRFGLESSTDAVVNAAGDIAASVFYGDASAEGYSAFNATQASTPARADRSGP